MLTGLKSLAKRARGAGPRATTVISVSRSIRISNVRQGRVRISRQRWPQGKFDRMSRLGVESARQAEAALRTRAFLKAAAGLRERVALGRGQARFARAADLLEDPIHFLLEVGIQP